MKVSVKKSPVMSFKTSQHCIIRSLFGGPLVTASIKKINPGYWNTRNSTWM